MVSYDVLGPGGRAVLHAQTLFVQSDAGKITKSGAEVKFGSMGSWIDLHTDRGLQRVLVWVKRKTFGLSIGPAPGSSPKQMTQPRMPR